MATRETLNFRFYILPWETAFRIVAQLMIVHTSYSDEAQRRVTPQISSDHFQSDGRAFEGGTSV